MIIEPDMNEFTERTSTFTSLFSAPNDQNVDHNNNQNEA